MSGERHQRRWPVAGVSRRGLIGSTLVVGLCTIAGIAMLLSSRGHDSGSATAAGTKTSIPMHRTRLTALPHSLILDGTKPVRVRLSGPPAPQSPWPIWRPAIAGRWSTTASTEYFTPASTFEPCTTYELTIPASTVAEDHLQLARSRTITVRVACPPTAGAQLALARLGYLPARLRPRAHGHLISVSGSRRMAAQQAFRPPRGHFVAEPSDAPPVSLGALDPTTRGAITVFQTDHRLSPSGTLDSHTWASLLAAESLNHRNPRPYTWVSVSEDTPEILEVHRGHHIALSSPTNTGVPGAETAQGIFPIFARFESTTMIGTNPDGSRYNDPGVPWVNYFNGGDAVHGFPRGSYGSPQSNGCVELPISTAQAVYRLLEIGDIVYVS